MQIQKMLNVLILIFLLINIGVFFYLRYEDQSTYTMDQERIEQVRSVLEEEGILIYTTIIDNYHPMPRLAINEPEDMTNDAVMLFFDSEPSWKFLEDEEKRYEEVGEDGNITAVLKINQRSERGRITYTDTMPEYVSEDFNSIIDNQVIAKKFVKDITMEQGDYVMIEKKENKDKAFYFFSFNEKFEGALLFCNEVRLKLEKNGISEAVAIRYVPAYFTEESTDIYPADEVLYKFAVYVETQQIKDVRITAMDIGYHLGPDGLYDLKTTEIGPYYRIKIASGQTFYINAYTNEMSLY